MAVGFGLSIYLNERTAGGCLELSRPYPGRPLLLYAIQGMGFLKSGFRGNLELLNTLLRMDSSPNLPCKSTASFGFSWSNAHIALKDRSTELTLWTFLLILIQNLSCDVVSEVLEVCELFIKAGAFNAYDGALHVSLAVNSMQIPLREQEILELAFGHHQARRLLSLRPSNLPDAATTDTAGTRDKGSHGLFWRAVSLLTR